MWSFRVPVAMTLSTSFVKILSIQEALQPGFSCVARDINGKNPLLNNMSSYLIGQFYYSYREGLY